jgi:hypothetical protein
MYLNKTIQLETNVKMSEENCSDSDVSVSCTPPELKSLINSAVSNLIPEKSKRQSYLETLICIKY